MRLSWIFAAAASLALTHATTTLAQDNYPDRPITAVLPGSAGGTTDIIARLVMNGMDVGQSFVFENKPGAGGQLAYNATANATPDGYTLTVAGGAIIVSRLQFKNFELDILDNFTPVAKIADAPFVLLLNDALPVKNAEELREYAKNNRIRAASIGGSYDFETPLFMEALGITGNVITYKDTAQIFVDLGRGDIHMALIGLSSGRTAGKGVKVVAVSGVERHPAAPDIPTFAEFGMSGFGEKAPFWYGIFGPKGLSQDVQTKLSKALEAALQKDDVKARLEQVGATVDYADSAEFIEFIKAEKARLEDFVKRAGIQPK